MRCSLYSSAVYFLHFTHITVQKIDLMEDSFNYVSSFFQLAIRSLSGHKWKGKVLSAKVHI